MLFEWDESKRQSNLVSISSTFKTRCGFLTRRCSRRRAAVAEEERVLAIGLLENIEIVVVYVIRGKRRRIISARRAHRDERQDYANHLTNPPQRRN
jgi:uncharacterized DUF497 family protein